ncbi:hypothetical protein CL633_00055 [bacterium]|nr:hypothetical protein [bacterium]
MKFINKIANFFTFKQYILYLLLFVLSVSLFSYLHLDQTFADPDSFYHLKIAQLLNEQGIITEFPWLSATTLKYNFIDHHFLYHLALIPFIIFFLPVAGLKIATILFASLFILTFFWFLNKFNIKGAFWYAVFLLSINPFIFRLNLAKAQQLVLIAIFLVIYLLLNRRYLSLFVASGVYVWLYAGWPLVFLLTLIFAFINFFWPNKRRSWLIFKMRRMKAFSQNFGLLLSVGLGLVAGLFFSPYFAKNLQFYYQQSFKIALINYQNLINVGGEWYPYNFFELVQAALPFFVLLIFAIILFVSFGKKQTMNSWFFFALSIIFFILTLKSRRYVEYFIPLALCFSALSINASLGIIKESLTKIFPRNLILLSPIILLLIFSPFFYKDIQSIKNSYKNSFRFDKFASAASWLKENSNRGDIVFHSDWDEFPILFYHNDKNYYLVGLDPTFMYEYDNDLYQRWSDITTGQSAENLLPTIKNIFGAKYVFVDIKQNEIFDHNLSNNFYFLEVFKSEEAKIYKIVN